MAANLLHRLNRTIDRLFGFDLTAEEVRRLEDGFPPAADPTSSQHPPVAAPLPPTPRPVAR